MINKVYAVWSPVCTCLWKAMYLALDFSKKFPEGSQPVIQPVSIESNQLLGMNTISPVTETREKFFQKFVTKARL